MLATRIESASAFFSRENGVPSRIASFNADSENHSILPQYAPVEYRRVEPIA